MKPKLLILTLALAATFVFTGGAGGVVDRDFRAKVKDLQGGYDPVTKATRGEIRNTIEFRDPNP